MVRYFTDIKYLSLKYKNQSWQTMATYLHPHNVPILNYSSGPLPGFKKTSCFNRCTNNTLQFS